MSTRARFKKSSMGPIKRRRVEQPEALTFDPEARSDYLTGFHKRKVARIKHAKETAVKKDREERIKQRKEVRLLSDTT